MSLSGPSHFQHRASDDSDSSMGTSSDSSASRSTVPSSLPSLEQHESKTASPAESEIFDYHPAHDPRESENTYCSTVEDPDDDYPYYDTHPYVHYHKAPPPQASPSTPSEFAELFPSTRCLSIRHDDSTLDGNMNLRVAHIKRKTIKPAPQRPRLQRSVSKALHSFRGRTEAEPVAKLNRQDSGYSSSGFDGEEEEELKSSSEVTQNNNICTLEFSNYAHVDLTRRGGKGSKKYDFEYWGKSYSWKRVAKQVGPHAGAEEISYQLANNSTGNVVAHIVPDPLSPTQAQAEEAKGGIVPPCSFWLRDSSQDPIILCLADVADVIMATGLTALVDDCIKRRFHKKKTVQLVLPMPMIKNPMKMNLEYVGPKRLIDEVFNRRPTLSRSQSTQSSRSPLPVRSATA
ncbi:unnamed protein product [Tuber melanosporum]|uniref:(Perigord truffle) hypothetical protein n=1 Tax=Tuber melanosporum (strain Mel28) TaxID=656061 RepID=D5GJP2_TUBMM|nr:uncharacterized protein GSTUM_00009095001 [Tuber melanosporum]CAZ84735.1 unnamed protein product [Tuber melanosporum]